MGNIMVNKVEKTRLCIICSLQGCRKQFLIDQVNLVITGPDLWGMPGVDPGKEATNTYKGIVVPFMYCVCIFFVGGTL